MIFAGSGPCQKAACTGCVRGKEKGTARLLFTPRDIFRRLGRLGLFTSCSRFDKIPAIICRPGRDQPVPIRRVCTVLCGEKAGLEEVGEAPVDLSSTFCGVKLENPFLLPSSVVASSYEKIARAFDMGWAGACFKTLCDFIPREASPRYSALSGSNGFYGFKNIEQLSCDSMEEDLEIIRRLKRDYPSKVIIASIMGRDEAEWTRLARLVEEAGADMVERYTAARRECTIPLLAKLTPNVGDMRPMALAAKRGGADGLATCPGWENPPISGMGGIETWRDAVEFLLLGADHVQITTAVMQYGLRIIYDLLDGLTLILYLREKALTHVTDLKGLGVENVAVLEDLERESVLLPRFDRSRCLGCGRCYLSCRDGGHEALTMRNGGPVMDPNACVGCHLCVLVCPAGAVSGYGKRLGRR